MSKILTGTVFLMIFGWFVFVNRIEYGIAGGWTAKGWPMMYSCTFYELGGVSPRALAVNWGLALVVSVVGAATARTVYMIVVSRLSGLKKNAEQFGRGDGDKPPN
jgi:hypothetical protein